jgi:hypothetical protein
MPNAQEVARLAESLHESEIVNLKQSVAAFIRAPGLDIIDPAVAAGWYVVGGDHYVIVCGITGEEQLAEAVGERAAPWGDRGAKKPGVRARDVTRLAESLQEQGLVNLDEAAGKFMRVPGLDIIDPAVAAGWYVVGGDHYVIVCGITGSERMSQAIR